MCSGERPICAAKGKQSDTEALCQPPPTPANPPSSKSTGGERGKTFAAASDGAQDSDRHLG